MAYFTAKEISQTDPRQTTVFEENFFRVCELLEEDFSPRCDENRNLVRLLQKMGQYRRAQKIFECGNYLYMAQRADFSEPAFPILANFCKDRLCAMCSWRRSLKIFSQVSQVMDVIEQDYSFVFVTLTLRNVPAKQLVEAIDSLQEGFNMFMHYSEVRKAFCGYFKALEITRNDGLVGMEWHPHLHIIFAVKRNYFRGKNYLTWERLRQLWQQALGVNYAPQVDIRKVKPKGDQSRSDDSVAFSKAVREAAKYTLKTKQIFRGSEANQMESVRVLTDALKGRRLCSFGGIFKETARRLKLNDLESGDLTDQDKLRPDVEYLIFSASWMVGVGYFVRYKNTEFNIERRNRRIQNDRQ